MTADASVYAPLTNAVSRAPAVKQPAMRPFTTGKKPWRETPLVESANLSEAAGWYGAHPSHPSSYPSHFRTKTGSLQDTDC
jgi:hypothetical protein